MRGIVISGVGRLHGDPEIARPPSSGRFQTMGRHTEMSEHADGIFAYLFRPVMQRLSQLYCYVSGPELGAIRWSRQGREHLNRAIVGGLEDRSPLLFRPGSFPSLAGFIRNNWFSLLGVEGPENTAIAKFQEYDAACRACRLPKKRRRHIYYDADSLEAVERAFVERHAGVFIRGWDGTVWEAYFRDPALISAIRGHLEEGDRLSLKEGTVDLLWQDLRPA